MLEDRGALAEYESDLVRDYEAMHAESFLSCWLRDVTESKAEEVEELHRKAQEGGEGEGEGAKCGKRDVEGGR